MTRFWGRVSWRENAVDRLLVLLAAGLVALSAVAAFLAAWEPPPPLDVSPGASIDLGTVLQGATVQGRFLLHNRSSYPVELARIVPSCGCTGVVAENRRLEADESTSLQATFAAGASRGDQTVRVLVFYRMRASEVATMGRLELGLQAHVDPDFVWSPAVLTFQESLAETRSVVVTGNRLPQLEISEAYCTHKAFRAELKRAPHGPQAEYRVDVSFSPKDWTSDSRSAELMVRTNSQGEPLGRIALEVRPSPRR